MDTLKILIPGKPEYFTMIRLATSSLAALAGFDYDAAEDIKMAVAEACKNVSCHNCDNFSDQFEIEYNIGTGSFEVTVTDACEEHHIEKLCKPCKQCPEEGDIGAIVMRSLMTCVECGTDSSGHRYINMVKSK